MAYEKFIDKNFQAPTLEIIEHARKITEDYKARGFTLTLRQLFYQFEAREERNKEGLEKASENWSRVALYLKHRTHYLSLEDYVEAGPTDLDELIDEMDARIDD